MSWNAISVSKAVSLCQSPSGLGSSCSFHSDMHCRQQPFWATQLTCAHALQNNMNITCSSLCSKGYIKSYIFNATFSMPIKRLYAKKKIDYIFLCCMGIGYQMRDMASGNASIQVQQPLAACIYMGFAENYVKLIFLQAPELVEPIGFLHLKGFLLGYHTRSAGECYPSQWVDDTLLFIFSVTTQKFDIFTNHCVPSYSSC